MYLTHLAFKIKRLDFKNFRVSGIFRETIMYLIDI